MSLSKAKTIMDKYEKLLSEYDINTPLRKSHFSAQISHESGFEPKEENLNYSVESLKKTFSYFKKHPEEAELYGRSSKHKANQKAIANRAYSNRMDNGNVESGDGWKYRGRGYIQLTGKYNYTELSKDTGIDYVSNPDLLLNEEDGLRATLWFWKTNGLNKYADADDVVGLTKKINGGTNGLSERQHLTKEFKQIFCA